MTRDEILKVLRGYAKPDRRTRDGSIILEVPRDRPWVFRRATPNVDGSLGGIFRGDEPITAAVYSNGLDEPIFVIDGAPNAWIVSDLTAWEIRIDSSYAAMLTRCRLYDLRVWARSPEGIGMLFAGKIKVA